MRKHSLARTVMASLPSILGDTPPVRSVLRIHALATGEAEVLIYGMIGENWWSEGLTAQSVVDQLAQITASTLRIRINSDGGAVGDGVAIYNALKRHPARKIVTVDGVACSIASLVAMAGDEVIMPENTLMMLHAAWAYTGGNAAQLRDAADALDSHTAAIATSYATKTGRPLAEIEKLLNDGRDHWFTAADAIAFGLADSTTETAPAEADATAAAAALLGYINAIATAPAPLAGVLRHRIQASATPCTFASCPEALQRSIVDHIEDSSMKQQFLHALAHVAGAAGAAAGAAPAAAGAPALAPTPTPAAAPVDVYAQIRERNTQIQSALRPHLDAGNSGIRALYEQALADPAMTIEQVNARALTLLGAQAAPAHGGGPRIEAGEDGRQKFTAALRNSLGVRAGLDKPDPANHLRGYNLRELARASLEQCGVRTSGLSSMEIVASAFTHSTSDFPLLLGNVAERSMLRGYEETPEVFDQFSRPISLNDFRESSMAGLGHFDNLDKIPQGAEYKYGTFGEHGNKIRIVKFGKLFSITREAIINDDMNAFTEVPRKMGRAAKRTLADEVFALLTANPVMPDGNPLFHAAHKNLATGAAISTASIDALRAGMALQTSNGMRVRVPLKYLVVPVGLGGLARTVLASEFEVGPTNKNNTTPNIVRNTFEVIEDPRLDADDPKAWYGVADPNLYDGLIVGYLEGKQEPYTEQKEGWKVDGIEYKVRLEAGASVVDWIGLAMNPGP